MKTLTFCAVFSLYLIPHIAQTAETNSNKLGDVLKNHTKSVFNSTKNQDEEDNLLKQETHKLLSECGVETSDNNYDDNDYGNRRGSNKPRRGNNNYDFGDSGSRRKNRRRNNNRDDSNESSGYSNSYNNRYGNRNRGNRYSNYDNDNEKEEDNDSNESNNRHYGSRKQKNNSNKRNGNKRYNNENYSDEEESDESNQSGYNRNKGTKRFNRTMSSSNNRGYNSNNNGYNSGSTYGSNGYSGNGYSSGYSNGYNHDCKDENHGYYDSNNRNQWKPYGASEGNYGYDGGNYGYNSFGNNGNLRRGVSGPGYTRNFDINLRAKRSNNDDDDLQCVSQCVFGYLEVLDENRVPSETMVIKWLQDHLTSDMKRIRALREARRCFARLSTSDMEDGCEFSQSLSKCLNLELE